MAVTISVGVFTIGGTPGSATTEARVSSVNTSVNTVNIDTSAVGGTSGQVRSLILGVNLARYKCIVTFLPFNLVDGVAERNIVKSMTRDFNDYNLRLDIFNIGGAADVVEDSSLEHTCISVEDILILR
jgi:hypothetical protein